MRLPNNFGSVYKLSGARRKPWCARKTSGWKDNGQPIYSYIGYYPTRAEALTALATYNEDPYDLKLASVTFGEVYERWSEGHFQKLSRSGVNSYSAAFKACGQQLTDMKMADIKIDHLQKALDDSGKNTPMLMIMKSLMGMMYTYAVVHEIVPPDKRDMVRFLDTSKPGNPQKKNHETFTQTEIDKLWGMEDTDVKRISLILIYSGVRINELLELDKTDVHLDDRWFYVKKAKTRAGVRQVPIAEKVAPFFEYWMEKAGSFLISLDGKKLSYSTFRKSYWEPVMEDLGTEHRPHDTRHTCISLLTEAGVDARVIKEIVGHKGAGVTEAVYTHLPLSVKLEAINKI